MTTAVKQHCPYCADAAPDGGAHDCPTCGAPHHEDCWQENGGCAVFGCASAPRADAQTAELPPIAPESAEEVPRRRSRSRGVLIAGGVILLLIALAAAGGAAALMLRDSNKTEVAPDGPSEPAAVTSEPASGVESTDRGTTASPSPVEHVEYKTYVPSDEGYYYAAQIPSGPDWSDPSESFPTGGALLRTTVSVVTTPTAALMSADLIPTTAVAAAAFSGAHDRVRRFARAPNVPTRPAELRDHSPAVGDSRTSRSRSGDRCSASCRCRGRERGPPLPAARSCRESHPGQILTRMSVRRPSIRKPPHDLSRLLAPVELSP